jgi:8-oxo-dGTP pyrophosphatase MutT (NUDIX family)
MYKAVGTTFLSKETGRILLNLRSGKVKYPHTWSFWGGKIEKNEEVLDALRRELKEEMGFVPPMQKLNPLDTYTSKDKTFIYYTFVILTDNEFIPTLNHESSGYAWVDIAKYPKPLHDGANVTLTNRKNISKLKQLLQSQTTTSK